MKRKLILFLLTLVLGYESPKIFEYGEIFYKNLSNPQVGPEVAKLVDSLESGKNWQPVIIRLRNGDLWIRPGWFLCDIEIGEMPIDGQYSYADRVAINRAAAKCLRVKAAQIVEPQEAVASK